VCTWISFSRLDGVFWLVGIWFVLYLYVIYFGFIMGIVLHINLFPSDITFIFLRLCNL
jgi:hypothetical protein